MLKAVSLMLPFSSFHMSNQLLITFMEHIKRNAVHPLGVCVVEFEIFLLAPPQAQFRDHVSFRAHRLSRPVYYYKIRGVVVRVPNVLMTYAYG